ETMSAATSQDLNILVCKLCNQTLRSPRILPCMHIYCVECLDKLVEDGQRGFQLKCPGCREEHMIPEGGVKNFKISLIQDDTSSKLFETFHQDGKPTCAVCAIQNIDKIARVMCINCSKVLCAKCRQLHDNFVSGHAILNLTDDKIEDEKMLYEYMKEPKVNCPKHKNNVLNWFCEDDNSAICSECIAINHKGHKYVDIHKAAENNKILIDELLKDGENRVDVFDTAIKQAKLYRDNMQRTLNNATDVLTNEMNAAILTIRESYTSRIDDVIKQIEDCTNPAEDHIKNIEDKKANIENTIDQLHTMKDKTNNAELANITNEIHRKRKQWKQNPKPDFNGKTLHIKTQPGKIKNYSESLGKITIKLGKVTVKDTVKTDAITLEEVTIKDTAMTKDIFTFLLIVLAVAVLIAGICLSSLDHHVKKVIQPEVLVSKKLNGYIQSLQMFDNDKLITVEEGSVYMYNSKLEQIKYFEINYYVSNVITTKSKLIGFTTSKIPFIRFIKADGSHVRQMEVPKLNHILGLSVNSKNELIVSDFGDKSIYHVDITSGDILAKSTLGLFEYPLYIATNSKDVVIVSDYLAHRVTAITRDGDVVFRYGTQGSGQNQLYHPAGICTDNADNVIVIDSLNKRVHLLSPNGTFLQYLMTKSDGLVQPKACVVNHEGHALVGDQHGNIHIIKYRE
ncbi:unnamed protein product, partial [Owenia fusiformis]